MHTIEVGEGKKGGYKHLYAHANPSLALAYFHGMRLLPNYKARLINEKNEVVATRKSW
jgi:hypothetical protein